MGDETPSPKIKPITEVSPMPDVKRAIAADLLSIGAVFLRPDDPFTWASGIKSPIYCDNRLTLSAPDVRRRLETAIADTVREKYPDAEALFGTSTAGIGHAAIAAFLLDMPMGYVRGSAKDHGRVNQIEGKLARGDKVVVIEDLISTGGSVVETVEALRAAGAEVLGVVSIFTYGMAKGLKRLAEAGVENTSMSDFDTLVQLASETGVIAADDVPRLLAFRDNPGDESWIG
jgi:orotate phosphoribosyltransferase